MSAGDVGIEPTLAVLETAVLPLNESPELHDILSRKWAAGNETCKTLKPCYNSTMQRFAKHNCGYRTSIVDTMVVVVLGRSV